MRLIGALCLFGHSRRSLDTFSECLHILRLRVCQRVLRTSISWGFSAVLWPFENAQRHGWGIVAVFQDEGISGSKGRDKRPQFDALHKAIARREIDLVAAWSVDRIGRSLSDLIAFLGDIHVAGVGLYLHQQGLDTTSPSGRAMFGMLGIFAEYERAILVERTKAELRRAVSNGKRLGRPRLAPQKEIAVRRSIEAGNGVVKTAKMLGVGVGTILRIKRQNQ
jgi:DNA invertase Pin-like site-specific DNA recombinase